MAVRDQFQQVTPGNDSVTRVHAGESKSIFISFLELFFSRWILICGIFFSASFWSYYVLMKAPDTYEATGQVLIRRGAIQAMREEPILRQQEEVGSELDIIASKAVLSELANQLLAVGATADTTMRPLIYGTFQPGRPSTGVTLADLPTTDPEQLKRYLANELEARKFGESNVIELSLISPNPRFAAESVNALIDVYEKYDLSIDQATGQVAFFEREIDKSDREINALQGRLATLMRDRGVVDPQKERELLALRRHGLQVTLDEVQVDKVGVERDLEAVDRTGDPLDAKFVRDDWAIQSIREGLFGQQAQLAELRTQYQDDSPTVVAKRQEVQELQQNLEREMKRAVEQQRHLLRQIVDKERELNAKISETDAHLLLFPGLEAEIDQLDRDIKQRTIKRIDTVEQMVKASTMERKDESLNKVRVLGYSDVPVYPREARRGFKLMVAVLLSLIAAFITAIFVEGLDHTIRKRDEIEGKLQISYLVSLSSHPR